MEAIGSSETSIDFQRYSSCVYFDSFTTELEVREL
jgi:hypothetical protein